MVAMRTTPSRASWIVTGALLLTVLGACVIADVATTSGDLSAWLPWLEGPTSAGG